MFIGSSYGTAYHHFIADHSTPLNLKLHLICLVIQLLANFALLSELDNKLNKWLSKGSKSKAIPTGWLSGGTAMTWSIYLISISFLEEKFDNYTEVPFAVRLGACACIFVAWQVAPFLRSSWVGLVGLESVVTALAIETVVLKKAPFGITFFIALSAHLAIWHMITKPDASSRGVWKGSTSLVFGVFFSIILLVCTKKDPVAAVVMVGTFGSWPLALLCDEPALAFYGLGYLATASQGIAHAVSGEPATLLRLNEAAGMSTDAASAAAMQAAKVAYEWGHVTNFPNLLLHACAKVLFPNA